MENKGILYGVSVGFGPADMMTLAAVKTVSACKTVAVPRSGGERSLALDIAKQAVDFTGKEIVFLDFPMMKDNDALDKAHKNNAQTLCTLLKNGDCAFICLGDISVYSTFSYLTGRVEEEGFEVRWISGVPSFCGAACAVGIPLGAGNTPLLILPYGAENFDTLLETAGTKVIMKCGKNAPVLIDKLDRLGLTELTYAVESCGLESQAVYRGRDIPGDIGYFTVFIVK